MHALRIMLHAISLLAFALAVLWVACILTEDKVTHSKQTYYIPKSKRNRTWKMVKKWWQGYRSRTIERRSEMETHLASWLKTNRERYRQSQRHRHLTIMANAGHHPTAGTRPYRSRPRHWTTSLLVMNATVGHQTLAMQARRAQFGTRRQARFDTDSVSIGVDNRCSTCMSDNRSLFGDDLVGVPYKV